MKKRILKGIAIGLVLIVLWSLCVVLISDQCGGLPQLIIILLNFLGGIIIGAGVTLQYFIH